MMIRTFKCFVLIMTGWHAVLGQEVEHNYLVGPQYTTCDSLDIHELDPSAAIESVEKAVFRFNQKFKLSRISGVQNAHFYSCDGESGYLIVTYGGEKRLHEGIPRKVWDELIRTPDIDDFYKSRIIGDYGGPAGK